jgi:cellulose synthase/poly-beta-1,6-N-acetylglucosamine synthase-like glycosyltransferase
MNHLITLNSKITPLVEQNKNNMTKTRTICSKPRDAAICSRNGENTSMVSVIIPTLNSERVLALTLSALIPGAMSGLVREVTIVDGGSTDMTLEIADGAGCALLASSASLGTQLRAAAAAARSPWLMFLRPGTVLEASWLDETTHFVNHAEASGAVGTAAVFRKSVSAQASQRVIREAVGLLTFGLLRRVHPDQGLLIGAGLYKEVGGHREIAADPEADLLGRLGRRRILLLRSGARR